MSKNILNGKNCLITGATGGIGKEIAESLAKNSCNLFLTGRDNKLLLKIKKDLERKLGINVKFQSGDVTRKKKHLEKQKKGKKELKAKGKINIPSKVFLELFRN